MQSAWRITSVSARAMRADGGHEVIAIAMAAFSMPGPRAATKAKAGIKPAKARKISVMRISTASSQPPASPAHVPTSKPTSASTMARPTTARRFCANVRQPA
jgi:hypothetical protein